MAVVTAETLRAAAVAARKNGEHSVADRLETLAKEKPVHQMTDENWFALMRLVRTPEQKDR